MNSNLLSSLRALRGAVIFVAALAIATVAGAAPPGDYYQTITGQTGSALKDELQAITSGFRGYPVVVKSYTAIRDILLNDVDSVGGGNVRLVYTSEIRSASQWATSINREHCWPQSRGVGSGPSNSDMHHVFLCDSSLNSSRNNDFYGNVNIGSATVYYPALGVNDRSYSIGETFQVSNNWKGNVARAILYMDTRYSHLSLVSTGQTPGTNQMAYLDQLLLWNAEDPVDADEQTRNDRVFAYQNNRNPYIDNPSWVGLVYGGAASGAPTLTAFDRSPTSPTAAQSVTVTVDATDPDGIASVTLQWRVGTSGGFTPVAMTPSGATYTGAIPAQAADTVVQYYVEAVDTLTTTAYAPSLGSISPASYSVVGEFPVMSSLSTNPSSITEADAVHIRVDADDNGGLGGLTVNAFWRIGSGSFTSIPMSIFSGSTWQTNTPIPAQPEGITVQYYTTATDASLNATSSPSGGAGSPSAYTVEGSLAYITATQANALGKLLITEAAHRVSAVATNEFVEIFNNSNQGFILDNLMIADDGPVDTGEGYVKFPSGTTIEPYGIIICLVRDEVTQAFVNSIPTTSNVNGAPVKVFATTGSLVFNGNPVVPLTPGTGGSLQMSNNEGIVLAEINTGDGSEESYTAADVIDGVGWEPDAVGNSTDPIVWGPSVTTTLASDAVDIGTTGDGVTRNAAIDTDTKADWAVIVATGPYNPGVVAAAFELPDVDIALDNSVLALTEGGATVTLNVHLDANPGRTVSISVVPSGGSASADKFVINSGSVLAFTTGNFANDQQVVFQKDIDTDAFDDTATFQLVGTGVNTRTVTLNETDTTSSVPDWTMY
jgi:endonuclease I